MFQLFNWIIVIMPGFIEGIIGIAWEFYYFMFVDIYCLALLIPCIAVAVRRLHDSNRSGWWLLLGLIPLIGTIVILVFMCQDSQPGENQYGPNPKDIVV